MIKLDCMHCKRPLHLNHPVFWRYQGPVKCFHCGKVMDVNIFDGRLQHSGSRNAALQDDETDQFSETAARPTPVLINSVSMS